MSNSAAGQEEESFKRQLDIEKETNRHRRSERTRNLFSEGMLWLVRSLIFVTVTAVLVTAWHHLAPSNMHWLSDEQLADIRTFLFSGAVISAATSHLQRNL